MALRVEYGGRFLPAEQVAVSDAGWIFRATDLTTDAEVVLEVFRPEACDLSPRARERFERAMRSLAALDHGNVGRVLGAGIERGSYYVASEAPLGQPLAATSLDDRRVIEVALDVADVLVAAHRAGVVHGGLTAEVVLLNDDGRVIVTGFGRVYALDGPDGIEEGPAPLDDLHALAAVISSALGDRPAPDGLGAALARLTAAGSEGGYGSAAGAQADLDLLLNGHRPATATGPADPVGDRPGVIASLPLIGKLLLGVLCLGAVLTFAFFMAGRLGLRADDPAPARVPDVTGVNEQLAAARVEAAGLHPRFENQVNAEVTRGQVIRQTPTPGTELHAGDKVTLLVSLGGDDVIVPSVLDRPVAEAEAILSDLGLIVDVTAAGGTNRPPGTVYSQSPTAESQAKQGDHVALFVAAPP